MSGWVRVPIGLIYGICTEAWAMIHTKSSAAEMMRLANMNLM